MSTAAATDTTTTGATDPTEDVWMTLETKLFLLVLVEAVVPLILAFVIGGKVH
jgi:hypothetical protein